MLVRDTCTCGAGASVPSELITVWGFLPSCTGKEPFDAYENCFAYRTWWPGEGLLDAGVIGSERDGGFAEYAAVPAENEHPINSPLTDDAELATFPTTYLTAEHMLNRARGEHSVFLESSKTWFGPTVDCMDYLDPLTDERRPFARDDCRLTAMVADALPNFSWVMTIGMAADRRKCILICRYLITRGR